MKKILAVLFVVLLAGCQAGSHSPYGGPAGLNDPDFMHPKTADAYYANAMGAIQYQFYDAEHYKGKTCKIRIKQSPQQAPSTVKVESGDPDLCAAALKATNTAIQKNAFPFPPVEQDMTADFMP